MSTSCLFGHLELDGIEVGGSHGDEALDLVGGVGTLGLGLGSELLAEAGVGRLLVALEGVHLVVPLLGNSLELLASLLSVLLDLGSVGRDVTVELIDLGVGRRGPSVGRLVPGSSGELQGTSSGPLIPGHEGQGVAVTPLVGRETHVGEVGGAREVALGLAHSVVEVGTSNASVAGHVLEHLLLEGIPLLRVEREVARHLGTDRRDVALAVGNLIRDLLLNVVEVVHQAHAAVRGLRVNLTCLEHVSAADGVPGVHTLDDLMDVLIAPVGGDVHNRAAHGQSAHQRKGDAHVRLLLRGLGKHP